MFLLLKMQQNERFLNPIFGTHDKKPEGISVTGEWMFVTYSACYQNRVARFLGTLLSTQSVYVEDHTQVLSLMFSQNIVITNSDESIIYYY